MWRPIAWQRFKFALNTAIKNNIPQVISGNMYLYVCISWLNSSISKKMQKRKHLTIIIMKLNLMALRRHGLTIVKLEMK